jgi:hypothetical protein
MEFTRQIDQLLEDAYFSVPGHYPDAEFWPRVERKARALGLDKGVTMGDIKERVALLKQYNWKDPEEHYYDVMGRAYEEDCVPTYEEDLENGALECDESGDSEDSDGYDSDWWTF